VRTKLDIHIITILETCRVHYIWFLNCYALHWHDNKSMDNSLCRHLLEEDVFLILEAVSYFYIAGVLSGFYEFVKMAHAATSIKQTLYLKVTIFLLCYRKFYMNWTSLKRSPV
jgi:hypothetical protein